MFGTGRPFLTCTDRISDSPGPQPLDPSRVPQRTPFIGVKAAPHALLLAAAERPSQARILHSTAPTDVLGPVEVRPRRRTGADGEERFFWTTAAEMITAVP